MREHTRKNIDNDVVTASSGNVFADLGIPEAEEQQTKVKIAVALNQILDKEQGTQQEIADRLHADQPKVSAVRNYRLEGLSVERLMGFLMALDYDIDIKIKPSKTRDHSSGRLNVKVAA